MPGRWIVQQNAYKGNPLRAWIRLQFAALDGSIHQRELLVDTGNPCAVIPGTADLSRLSFLETAGVNSNFGLMSGAWLQVAMPELGVMSEILGFASDKVMQAARSSSPAFAGLAGLPLLRLVEYGGDSEKFWLRTPSSRL